jgi:hypothetical protein
MGANNATTGEFWAQKAHRTSDNRGKLLRRDGFCLAEDKYGALLSRVSLEVS